MISANYFEKNIVQDLCNCWSLARKCGIGFAIFLIIKLNIDHVVTVVRILEIHRVTKKSVSCAKILLSATNKLFMLSVLNSIYSPNKPTEFSTAMVVEMQESMEHMYLSIQTQPNTAPNTISSI